MVSDWLRSSVGWPWRMLLLIGLGIGSPCCWFHRLPNSWRMTTAAPSIVQGGLASTSAQTRSLRNAPMPVGSRPDQGILEEHRRCATTVTASLDYQWCLAITIVFIRDDRGRSDKSGLSRGRKRAHNRIGISCTWRIRLS